MGMAGILVSWPSSNHQRQLSCYRPLRHNRMSRHSPIMNFSWRAVGIRLYSSSFGKSAHRFAGCAYYRGETKIEFDNLLLQIIGFCKDRLDASRKERGERGRYLYDSSATEWQLQSDLREFLQGNCPWADVRSEVEGIGAGRCDLIVSCGDLRRYIIELKREFHDCYHEGLQSYLKQSIAYQATNIPLGFLGVLDLTTRSAPPPHLATNIWVESSESRIGDTRYAVVFRIPGNLVLPSSFSK